MNKEKAIKEVMKKGFDFESSILEMYIYPTVIKGHLIEDTFDVKLFDNCFESGWFIWIDPCTIANWSHNCYYYFVTENNMYEKAHGWMPKFSNMEQLK